MFDVAEESEIREGFRIPNRPKKDLLAGGLMAACEVPAIGSRIPNDEPPPARTSERKDGERPEETFFERRKHTESARRHQAKQQEGERERKREKESKSRLYIPIHTYIYNSVKSVRHDTTPKAHNFIIIL
jgi:hypothetical protein